MGFEEIKEKIKDKICFWKGKCISLKGRVKITNIFILSKLWYLLECQDIPKNIRNEINNMIMNFIWNDLHQRDISVVHQLYIDGGLELHDIQAKQKTFRIIWLKSILDSGKFSIERHLANTAIGKYKGVYGVCFLNHNKGLVKFVKNMFYRESIKNWKELEICFMPGEMNSIKRNWIYEHILIKDDDGKMFKPPTHIPPYAPEFIYDLPVTAHPREFKGVFKTLIPKINMAFRKIKFNEDRKDSYYILLDNKRFDILEMCFKDLYKCVLKATTKPYRKHWVEKWNTDLSIEENQWAGIWKNVHDNLLSYKVQSSIWEMLHRNFMCSYFANIAFNESAVCKLCGQVETERTHIFTKCLVIKGCYEKFDPLIKKCSSTDITDLEKVVGLQGGSSQIKLRNYITFSLRHVVFRNRNKTFGNLLPTIDIMCKKIEYFIINDVTTRYWIAQSDTRLDKFENSYLVENILGKLENNELVLENFMT